jgi:Ribbon-helix-helix protein, copG family
MRSSKYGTSGGLELTDAVIKRLAQEAEIGYESGRLRPRTGRRGRPPIGSQAAEPFQVRLEPDLREALERAADAAQMSSSEFARVALRTYLERAGIESIDSMRPPVASQSGRKAAGAAKPAKPAKPAKRRRRKATGAAKPAKRRRRKATGGAAKPAKRRRRKATGAAKPVKRRRRKATGAAKPVKRRRRKATGAAKPAKRRRVVGSSR